MPRCKELIQPKGLKRPMQCPNKIPCPTHKNAQVNGQAARAKQRQVLTGRYNPFK